MTKQSESEKHQKEIRHGIPQVDRNNEPLSALVDGELDFNGADFLLRRLSDDPHMHRQWQRFYMVRACLQREFSGPVSLVDRVQAAVRDEAVPVRARRFNAVMRMGVGGAVAASVAVIAVLGLAERMDSETPGASEPPQAPAFVSQSTALDRQFNAPLVPAGLGSGSKSDSASEINSGTRQRINRYMIRHSQAAGGNGFISYAPVLAAPAAVKPSASNQSERDDGIEEGR